MIKFDPAAYQVLRSKLMSRILMEQVPFKCTPTGSYWEASKALASAGLGKGLTGRVDLNFHDYRLDAVLKPNVRRVALLLANFGPLYEREIHRCLGYNSRTAVSRAILALRAAGMVEQLDDKKLSIAKDCETVPNSPVDEVPQAEFRAAFTDVTKALGDMSETAMLVGDFAEGKGAPDGTAEVLVLFVPAQSMKLAAFAERLLNIASVIKAGHNVTIHQTAAASTDFMCFLHAKRGVWPGVFVRAGQGILLKPFRHDGEALFSAVQRMLTYPETKIQQLLESGTLGKKDDGQLFFTELGVRRYVRLGKPPVLREVKPGLSMLMSS